jgi:hypothetical protein
MPAASSRDALLVGHAVSLERAVDDHDQASAQVIDARERVLLEVVHVRGVVDLRVVVGRESVVSNEHYAAFFFRALRVTNLPFNAFTAARFAGVGLTLATFSSVVKLVLVVLISDWRELSRELSAGVAVVPGVEPVPLGTVVSVSGGVVGVAGGVYWPPPPPPSPVSPESSPDVPEPDVVAAGVAVAVLDAADLPLYHL